MHLSCTDMAQGISSYKTEENKISLGEARIADQDVERLYRSYFPQELMRIKYVGKNHYLGRCYY